MFASFVITCTTLVVVGLMALVSTYDQTQPAIGEHAPEESAVNPDTFLTPTPQEQLDPLPEIPAQVILTGGTHIFQTFNNCGPASLVMALSHLGINRTQAEIGQTLRPYQNLQGDNDDKSVTLTELAAYADSLGYVTFHRPAGSMEVIQELLALNIPVITRTWLTPGEDIGHYRVIIGYDLDRKILIQDDSLQGSNLEYSYPSFNEIWQAFNYEFLVVVPLEKKTQVEQVLARHQLLAKDSSWQKALSLAQQQELEESDTTYPIFNQSVAFYELGKYQQSAEAFARVQNKLPSRMLWYQIEPLLAYYQLGEYEQVLSLSQRIITNQNRAYSELHYLRGLVKLKQGNPVAAAEDFATAARYNQGNIWKTNLTSVLP